MRTLIVCFASLAFTFLLFANVGFGQDWPQWRGVNRDGVWTDNVLGKFESDELDSVWSVEIGAGYSGPTVANGKVYVMDRITEPTQIERVLCFDAETGNEIWKQAYDCKYVGVGYPAGPRASVTVDGERAYSLGTMGNLMCFEANDGKVVWSKDLNEEYKIQVRKDRKLNRMPIWGMTCSPIVFEDLVILQIGAIDAGVVAFNKTTGKEIWKATSDRGHYSSPALTQQNGKDVLVCWTGESVCGIAPLTGKVYWRKEMKAKQMPIGCASPVIDGNRIFVSSFYDGSMMLEMSEKEMSADIAWREVGQSEMKTKALHSMISTPIIIDDHIYGVDSYGELRCLNAETGERVWEDLTAVPKARWSTIHFVKNGEQVWMFNERGDIIISKLSPSGFDEISRAHVIDPTTKQLPERGGVCWSHPAFAMQSIFARNDNQLVRVSVAKE